MNGGKMELSNLEESLSGPIPNSLYKTIAWAEENDIEFGVKLRIAESNLINELKKLKANERKLEETNQKKNEWQDWFDKVNGQYNDLLNAQKIMESNLSSASAKLSECLEKQQMLENTLEEATVAVEIARNEERKAAKEYRRKSASFGARSTLDQLHVTEPKFKLPRLEEQ